MSNIKWSQIEAECGDYRDGFVATFRKYEGQPTDEIDGAGRRVKVTQTSFARHSGVPETTFRQWLGAARAVTSDERVKKDAVRARTDIQRLPPTEKAKLTRELLDEPATAQAFADDPEALRTVNRAVARTDTGKQVARELKAHDAREEDTGPQPITPLQVLPMFLDHAAELREFIGRATVDGVTADALPMIEGLAKHLIATGEQALAITAGAPVKVTDDDIQTWLNGNVR